MKTFITENFLLNNKIAEQLYHNYAKDMPLIDYHCHLSPQEIAINKTYRSITEMWLDGDHYKWRAIRSAGFPEEQITPHLGKQNYSFDDDFERFLVWAKVLPQTLGNPLYHWTHLELLRYFNIDELLTLDTASHIYQQTNQIIAKPTFSAQNLIKQFHVKFIGTTDDPIDTLEYHKSIIDNDFGCTVTPSWRPDKLIKIELKGFKKYIDDLSKVCDLKITSLEALMAAIKLRIEHFKMHHCCIADNGLDEFVFTSDYTDDIVTEIFHKALANMSLTTKEIAQYKSYMLVELGKLYAENNWVMQLHIGALRNNNTKLFKSLGADIGCDSINDKCYASELSTFLDTLNQHDKLPKTIIYPLNPRDNEMIGAMIGNFQGNIPGKIQLGSGWWFNDQKNGMIQQLTALSALGLLPKFVGMLTDSRSFLSFSRHEYFRRILCNMIGTWATNGEIPNDLEYLGYIIQDICFNNAQKYFNLN